MNNLKKKKKGFTLIELMAVIAIIAILAAVLVPTVNGYINRSKKTAVITQVRTIVNAVEAYNATSTNIITGTEKLGDTPKNDSTSTPAITGIISKLTTSEFIDSTTKLDSLPEDITYESLQEINSSQDALDKITIKNNKMTKWTGNKPYGVTTE